MEPPITSTVRTVEHADPSPVPENNWLWRRTYTFVVTALLCGHIGWLTWNSDDPGLIRETVRNDQGIIVLFALLYLAGASAEAIGRIVAAIKTSRKETVTQAAPPATITTTATSSKVETPPPTRQPLPGVGQEKPPWQR